jgi:hypothetical protein
VTDRATRRRVIEHRRPVLQRFAVEAAGTQVDDDLVTHAPMIEVTFEQSPA